MKDDDDLEFQHLFTLSVDLASTNPSGITAGDPLQITITDDGEFHVSTHVTSVRIVIFVLRAIDCWCNIRPS